MKRFKPYYKQEQLRDVFLSVIANVEKYSSKKWEMAVNEKKQQVQLVMLPENAPLNRVNKAFSSKQIKQQCSFEIKKIDELGFNRNWVTMMLRKNKTEIAKILFKGNMSIDDKNKKDLILIYKMKKAHKEQA